MTYRLAMHAPRGLLAIIALTAIAGCATQTTQPNTEPSAAAATEPAAQQTAEPTARDTTEPAEKVGAAEPDVRVTREDIKPAHPVRYTVKPGDTLWDIAARFLEDPWVWPEIWSVNPQIENPHLIYPGDVITLAFINGEARLRVKRPGGPAGDRFGDRTVELEPKVHEIPLEKAIPAIPIEAIRQFLVRPRVVTREQLKQAPYIVGNYQGRLISAEGDTVFARGFGPDGPQAVRYYVYRPSGPLRDPETGEILGYAALYVGEAVLREKGNPVQLKLVESDRGILNGDRLMPATHRFTRGEYIPEVPEEKVEAQIISLPDAISQVGSNQVVVINHGEAAGAEVSEVLAIMQSGGTVRDPYAKEGETVLVKLPRRRVGTMMIVRTFDRVSYALILEAELPIQLYDHVTNP